MFQQDSCFIVQRSTSEIITEDETHSVIAEW